MIRTPILGPMSPKKNTALGNGFTMPVPFIKGWSNLAPSLKGRLLIFPKWAVCERILVFPFCAGHGFFHSIGFQPRGMTKQFWRFISMLRVLIICYHGDVQHCATPALVLKRSSPLSQSYTQKTPTEHLQSQSSPGHCLVGMVQKNTKTRMTCGNEMK